MRPRARASKSARWSFGQRASNRREFLKAVFAHRVLAASKHGLFSACDFVKREAHRKERRTSEIAALLNSERLARGVSRDEAK
jgi:hypothetical protein